MRTANIFTHSFQKHVCYRSVYIKDNITFSSCIIMKLVYMIQDINQEKYNNTFMFHTTQMNCDNGLSKQTIGIQNHYLFISSDFDTIRKTGILDVLIAYNYLSNKVCIIKIKVESPL